MCPPVRSAAILLALLSACNPGAFDGLLDHLPDAGFDGGSANIGRVDAAALDAAPMDGAAADLDAHTRDAQPTEDARPAVPDAQLADTSTASVDAGADASDSAVDAGPACFSAGASLISAFEMEDSPSDALPVEQGGAAVASVGAVFGAGRVGQSLYAGELAAVQSRLDAPSALTISAWLWLDSAPTAQNAAWVWKGATSGEDLTTGFWLVIAGPSFRAENARYLVGTPAQGHLGFGLTDGTDEQFLLTDQPFPLGRYVHVLASFDGTRARLYLDGVIVRDEQQLVVARSTTEPLRLASPLGGAVAQLSGQLDEVSLFDRALSTSEVNDLYARAGVVCTP